MSYNTFKLTTYMNHDCLAKYSETFNFLTFIYVKISLICFANRRKKRIFRPIPEGGPDLPSRQRRQYPGLGRQGGPRAGSSWRNSRRPRAPPPRCSPPGGWDWKRSQFARASRWSGGRSAELSSNLSRMVPPPGGCRAHTYRVKKTAAIVYYEN